MSLMREDMSVRRELLMRMPMSTTSIVGTVVSATARSWFSDIQARNQCTSLPAHRSKELGVRAGLAELVDQQLHALDRRQWVQYPAEDPHAVELFFRQQKLFLAGAGFRDIDGREHSFIHQLAVQMDFHVAGTLELFENDVIHA